MLPVERTGATSGSTKLVRELRLVCSGCRSRRFKSFLFFRPSHTRAFERGDSYADVWELRHHGLDPNDPRVVYWSGQKNPFLEKASEVGSTIWWKRLRRRSKYAWIINTAPPGNVTPHVPEPGHWFMTLGLQDEEIIKASNEKLVYAAIGHSMGKREVLVRVRPIVVKQSDA